MKEPFAREEPDAAEPADPPRRKRTKVRTAQGLSPGADRLWRLLKEFWRNNRAKGRTEFYWKQKTFMDSLGCSERTIRRHLREIEAAGLVAVVRKRAGNHYYFLDLPGAETGQIDRFQPVKLSGSNRSNCPVPTGQIVRFQPVKLSGVIKTEDSSEEAIAEKGQQQTAVAHVAAPLVDEDLFAAVKIREAAELVAALDVAEPLARQFAEADHRLAAAAASWVARMCQAKRGTPREVRNPAGLVCDVIRNPLRYRFERLASGDWIDPKPRKPEGPTPRPAREPLAPGLERVVAAVAGDLDAAPALDDPKDVAWREADDATRNAALAECRARHPHVIKATTLILDAAKRLVLERLATTNPTPKE